MSVERCKLLSQEIGVRTTRDNKEIVSFADIVVLAVKPQMMSDVISALKMILPRGTWLSLSLRGYRYGFLDPRLSAGVRVIRVMPNTPCLIGASATAYALGMHANDADARIVSAIFSAVGKVFLLDEKHLDAVTGLSGSGPAYVYMFIEALSDGGSRWA